MTTPSDESKALFFAAEAGVPYFAKPSDDPFADWLALMEVVEALCPEWPEREVPTGRGDYRL